MSLSYAESLSPFPHKGKVGMPELSETTDELQKKLAQLEQLIRQSRHTVVITGAGISTQAGIPDFRGPNGVWTLEKRGEKPSGNISFDQAQPTYSHEALCKMEQNGYLHFVISQNIDGLHHRSGLPIAKLAELHGNVFSEECEMCHTQIIRSSCVGSYCRKRTGNLCDSNKGQNKRLRCRGKLRDTILDWEDPLPELALQLSEQHCSKADLCLCLGTSLQIRPCRDLPRKTKKNRGKFVIVNLQKTTMDSLADLVIHERCDNVMKYLMEKLNLDFSEKKSMMIDSSFDTTKYSHVKKIVLLSGKRKSGKDYLGEKLSETLGSEESVVLHLSEPLKLEYAQLNRLDGQQLLDSSAYKEAYRKDMIKWGEEIRQAEPSIFCRKAIEQKQDACMKSSIWIVCDIRRYTDIDFFKKYFADRVLLVRIESSPETRTTRGWVFTSDVDDAESECQLDTNVNWSFVLTNNNDNNFNEQMNNLIQMIKC